MNDVQIIDNFLPRDLFLDISDYFFSSQFIWHWNEHKVTDNESEIIGIDKLDDFQFIHGLYNFNKPISNVNIQAFIDYLGMKHIVKAKANLTVRMKSIVKYGFGEST